MFKIMFYTGTILTIVFLLFSIFFFIKNGVAKLIGDVTGWNARKAIKQINQKGMEELPKEKAIKPDASGVLVHNASITGTLREAPEVAEPSEGSKKKTKRWRRKDADSVTTVLPDNQIEVAPNQTIMEAIQEAKSVSQGANFRREEEITMLSGEEPAQLQEEETTLLSGEEMMMLEGEETTLLSGEETTLLEGEETTLLSGEETTLLEGEETTLLSGEETTLLEGEETTLLPGEETTLLEGEETTLLSGEEKTEVLADNMAGTMIQQNVGKVKTNIDQPMPSIFEVEEEVTVVHTKDSI